MGTKPVSLSSEERRELQVLYLASHAPGDLSSEPSMDSEDGVVPRYHYELAQCLKDIGIEFEASSSLDHLLDCKGEYNYVFSVYNRAPFQNSEVFTSAVCEYLDLPYLGARPHIRSLAEDKHLTKILARSIGLRTPRWIRLNPEREKPGRPGFEGPYIMKPRFGAASKRINMKSVVESWDQVLARWEQLEDDREFIVEQFIRGANATVPVLLSGRDPWILPPVETVSGNRLNLQTHREKRFPNDSVNKRRFSDEHVVNQLKDGAQALFDSIHPVDYYRVDCRVEQGTNRIYLLEINVCCNLGSHASISTSASFLDISQRELVEHILTTSIRRQNGL